MCERGIEFNSISGSAHHQKNYSGSASVDYFTINFVHFLQGFNSKSESVL